MSDGDQHQLQSVAASASTSSSSSSDKNNEKSKAVTLVETRETAASHSSSSSTARHSISTHHHQHPIADPLDPDFVFPGPPPLNYTVHTKRRKRYIFIFFSLLLFESGVLPLILFYSLRWGAHLSITTNLAIITSLIGTVSGLKIAQRTYDLWFRTGHESRRPIGAGRYGVDAFHILINIGLGAFFVPLIIGSSLYVSPSFLPLPTITL